MIRQAVPCVLTAVLILLSGGCRDEEASVKDIQKKDYACVLSFPTKSVHAWEGEPFSLNISVTNTGRKTWTPAGDDPVCLSYHFRDAERRMIRFDNERFPFAENVPPGGTAEFVLRAKAPLDKGLYHLEPDLVREGTAWFKDYGNKTKLAALLVKARPWPENAESLTLDYGSFTGFRTARREPSDLLKLMRITLHRNAVTLMGKTGKVSGFRAGSGYPQIWIRDAATILPASRWYYDASFLTSWLEEHLAFQEESGALPDWFDSQGLKDKNTVETDQESSAVQAAFHAAQIVGAQWLKKTVRDRSLLERLENAMLFVLEERFDESLGLVTGAHTIDWGDVEDADADEEAVIAGPGSRWTADIYDQAMFYRAALDLAAMLEEAGHKEKAMFWTVQAQAVRKNADDRLWQPERGFYRVHIHLDPECVHDFDEDEMFALGGNVTAVLTGLADDTQSSLILSKALDLQKTYGLPTVSGVLLPPYPAGVFKHPAVDTPFEYQNGGLWDWFGGKLVYALFENGFSRAAKDKLWEITRKCVANGTLSEWDDMRGAARGSDFFSGSAGSLGLALFRGYFGLKLSAAAVSLEPKLGGESAKVHAYLPGADLFLAYEHRVLADGKTLILDFNSNFPGTGMVKVLLPWVFIAEESREVGADELEVTLDGQAVAFRKTRVLQDEFVILHTDFKNRRLKIRHR
ncbi:MAG: hypothetical protein JW747_06980 [Candidatus Aminicenantes bacterium]|nr:hypothetical protein [Candidatus Aminicenantes bacterium]